MNALHKLRRSVFESNVTFDPHTEPHYDVTPGQLTFTLIWTVCACAWVYRYGRGKHGVDSNHADLDTISEKETNTEVSENEVQKDDCVDIEKGIKQEVSQNATEKLNGNMAKTFAARKPPPSLDDFLKSVFIFGIIMLYFYLCDYRKIFPKLERVYNRDEFLFLVFLLFLVACAFTITPTPDKILNRDQTEEWKGWMQVMFVWYHVFAAGQDWYNWIRVYISAYVWMTGFGNFSFFWIRKDFSLWRFLKMQFRLNFLVTCLCVVTSNEYMLYYICAMHSYWFVSVYVFMGTLQSWNTDSKKMCLKFCAYLIINAVIFEIPGVGSVLFKPFYLIIGYTDPRFDSMHEWMFRVGLDHWACFFGMLCAYNYPHFENFMKNLEKNENNKRKFIVKLCMAAVCIVALFVWYVSVMQREKYAYNAVHPYTSMVPLLCFIVLRNLFPSWRTHYVGMFAWLGKITLETYLSQLHIYLQSNAKHLIGYIPRYHLLNFALATVIYLPISYVLFNLTTEFSSYLLPNDMKTINRNVLLIVLAFMVPYVGFYLMMHLL